MRDAFPELEGQGIFERVERVYATGEPDIEHEHTSSWDRGHGIERRSVNLVLQALRAEDGAVNGVLSFAIDVTELVSERGCDAILREESAAVLDLVTSGVIVTDADGRIVKVNRGARQITRTPFDVTRPIDEQAVETFRIRDAVGRPLAADELPVTRALRGETLPMADYRLDRGDPAGNVLIRVSVRPLRDVGGRVRGAILVFNETGG
jgi:PAS domain-containing protein